MSEILEQLQTAVDAKYRVVRELTRGGMARVFLAKDVQLERDVAIKVLSPDLVDPAMVERFRKEVLQTARLQHPTIIPLIEVGAITDADRPVPYYVMPYARGESARSRLSHEGPFSVSSTVRILRDVLGALEHAHGQGLVHRDLKPENIYLSGSHAMLADFGIAKVIAGMSGDHALTSPGETVGTPAYMAAEQMAADPALDHRADLYSVGVVAYELLAGRLPWRGDTPSERLAAQVRGDKEPLPALRNDMPEELVTMIEQCLAYDPADRPQSATDVLRQLDMIPVRSSTAAHAAVTTVSAATRARRVLRLPRVEPLALIKAAVLMLWAFANLSYAGMRAQNHTGSVARAFAFALGFPGTLVTLFAVVEGSDRAYGVVLPRR